MGKGEKNKVSFSWLLVKSSQFSKTWLTLRGEFSVGKDDLRIYHGIGSTWTACVLKGWMDADRCLTLFFPMKHLLQKLISCAHWFLEPLKFQHHSKLSWSQWTVQILCYLLTTGASLVWQRLEWQSQCHEAQSAFECLVKRQCLWKLWGQGNTQGNISLLSDSVLMPDIHMI